MDRLKSSQFASAAFLWPALIAESASEIASAAARELAGLAIERQPQTSKRDLEWSSPSRVTLELPTVRLREFSTGVEDTPTLICAPFALHTATITDFAPGHSLVGALQTAGIRRVFVTDWRSASPDMRFLSIDNYLADLNIVVDELRGHVNLIGLCQGGWMALMYASRFPSKVKKLALAGAPIDIAVGHSNISELARKTPMFIFHELVDIGCGRMIGQHALQFWSFSFDREAIRDALQSPQSTSSEAFGRLEARFRDWYASTLDLPGAYYLQVVEQLFKENRLATGRFVALGRKVDLSTLCCPLFLLAAQDDEVVASEQIFATEHLIDPRRCVVEKAVASGGHLALFMGKEVLGHVWPTVARWLSH